MLLHQLREAVPVVAGVPASSIDRGFILDRSTRPGVERWGTLGNAPTTPLRVLTIALDQLNDFGASRPPTDRGRAVPRHRAD